MKKQLVFSIAILFVLSIGQIKSQNFDVPEDYVLESKEDYTKYEKDVIACANWMENSPLIKDNKRIEANSFFITWLTGSPTVTVSIDADFVVKYTEKNPDLLVIFMAGWARYSLENNYSKDIQKGYYEGYKSIINVYKKGVGVKKDKNMEKLIKLYEKGELENWITENVRN